MAYYVYIIQSQSDGSYYKGYSEHPLLRLAQHNNKQSEYTSAKTPWKLVYAEEMGSKRDALIREKNLKKASEKRKLINSDVDNIIHFYELVRNGSFGKGYKKFNPNIFSTVFI